MNWNYHHPFKNVFSWAMLLLIVTGAAAVFYWTKADVFRILNQQHSYPGDLFFKYVTYVGDGLFMIVLAVVLIGLGRRKLGILMILSFLLAGLVAQTVKRINPQPRPGLYFSNQPQLMPGCGVHCVDGNLLKGNNSFPSGHTTTAFAMFSLLAFASRNKLYQLLFFVTAVIVGYSRVYLGQHFFLDVLAGAVIGYLTSFLLLYIFRNREFGGAEDGTI